jgi:hypothetical protein
VVRSLTAESAWVREHQHLFLIGPTGVGKTWLARAFAQKACRDGYTALFLKAAELFRDLAMARADGSHGKLIDRLGRLDLLIVDDWAMAPMTEAGAPRLPGDLRCALSDALHAADQSTAGGELAPADRRSHHRRQHPRPARAQCAPDRTAVASRCERSVAAKIQRRRLMNSRRPRKVSPVRSGARGLKRRPLAPHPTPRLNAQKRLTDADHFCMIRTAQRRFAPTAIGITRNGDRHQFGMSDRLRRNPHRKFRELLPLPVQRTTSG